MKTWRKFSTRRNKISENNIAHDTKSWDQTVVNLGEPQKYKVILQFSDYGLSKSSFTKGKSLSELTRSNNEHSIF